MSLKEEHNRLADLFGKLNSQEKVEDEFASLPEGDKMKFFWESCVPEKIDASSIIKKAQQKIKQDAQRRRRNYFLVASASIAASVLICISAINFLNQTDYPKADFQAMMQQMTPDSVVNEVTLITSKKQLNLDEDAYIQYNKEGKVAVNSQKVEEEKEEDALITPEEYDQLLVPVGKRAKIELSDGTLLTVNSQSKVIYPRRFHGKTRKIYAQGEVFLDVAHDKAHPFIVEANGFNLRVLGTKFNISNYEGEATNIVLVEGSVEVTDNHKKKARMSPSDLLNISDGTIAYQKQVDVAEYVSWVDGIFILNGNSLAELAQKLSKYYRISIECDPQVGTEKVYGKLDLKDDIGEILKCLQQTITFNIEKTDTSIYLYK